MSNKFKLDECVTINLTAPMKMALVRLASESGISVSDVIRITLTNNLTREFPLYADYYNNAVAELTRQQQQIDLLRMVKE